MLGLKNQVKTEIRQLPFMIGKLIGGAMAIIGFPGAIYLITRESSQPLLYILSFCLMGVFGIGIFLLSEKAYKSYMNENIDIAQTSKEKKQVSVVVWVLFLIIIITFLLITMIMAT